MAGRIEQVRPGRPAEDALIAAIHQAQVHDVLASVTVIVRSPVVALDLRRRIGERSPVAGARFLLMSRLIELLGGSDENAPIASGRPLSEPALRAAIRVALEISPGVLAKVAGHPATEESLVRTYRMIRPLAPSDRAKLASTSRRSRDIVRIVEEVRARLDGWYDLEDLAVAARHGLEHNEADLEAVGQVVVHLPDPLAASHVSLLDALAQRGEVTVLAGFVGEPSADRASADLVAELVSRGFGLAEDAPRADPPRRASEVVAAPDSEEEVRIAVRLLARHVDRGGTLGSTAIAFPASEGGSSYLAVIEELLASAGIPWTGPASSTLAESAQGRLVLDVLELLVEGLFERSAVIRWLSSPTLTTTASLMYGLSFAGGDGNAIPAGAFDRCSRKAGVVSGLAEWKSRLSSYIVRGEARASSTSPIVLANDLRRILGRLEKRSMALCALTTWEELASWASGVVAMVVEPGEEQDRLRGALEGLAELRRIEPLAADPGLGAPGLRRRQISSALTSALSRTVGTRGRFGVGPVVGTINALAGMRTELLVVVCAREGLLPGRTPEDPLVTELDRASVQVLADRERVEQRDRRTMLMLLAGAEQVVATYPRVDRGATRLAYPSRWLAGDLFDGRIEEIASFPAALAAVADGRFAPADPFDLELAVVARAMTARRPVSELFVARLGDLGRRLLAERERHAPYLSRFAGRVGPRASNDELLGEVLSPTRIEDLAKCPLQFMFGRLVKLEVLEAPDRLDTISARDRGTLIHEILERFVEQTLIGRESFLGWSTADWDLLRHIAEECFTGAESRGLTGKALYWQMERRQVLADLRRFLEIEQVRLLASGGRPLRTEVAFGFGDVAPVEISAGGDVLRFRGKVDRVDEERDGVVRVIDYKSGSAGDYGTIQSDPLGSGKHLQLPIYAKAAPSLVGFEPRTVVAEYRFCSSAAGFEAVPVTLTPELETDLSAVLSTLTRTIKDGIFPPRPGGDDFRPENCRRCEFASMCRLDRFTQWDRALSDPSVVDYVALVEPSRAAS